MSIGELLSELFKAEEMESEIEVSNIETASASDLVKEAVKIITFAENDDKDGYFVNRKRITKKYGEMGAIYILEFAAQLIRLVNKFKSVSKKSICIMAIVNKVNHK